MTIPIRQCPSPNCEPRKNGAAVRFIIIHCTETGAAEAEKFYLSADPAAGQISPHYMVDTNGAVTQYVDEDMRAWHAGASYWGGESDLNSASIGIELVNPGQTQGYPPYAAAQIGALIDLCRGILARHPGITPFNVLGHTDIAPGRKMDPGPAFPWEDLAAAGIGVMPECAGSPAPDVNAALTVLGYNPDVALDVRVQAFAAHYHRAAWRPDLSTETARPETLMRLQNLALRGAQVL